MARCFGKFRKKKYLESVQTVNNDIISYEIVYTSVEKKILQFVNSTNELLEQMSSHDVSHIMDIQKINIPRIVLTGTQ